MSAQTLNIHPGSKTCEPELQQSQGPSERLPGLCLIAAHSHKQSQEPPEPTALYKSPRPSAAAGLGGCAELLPEPPALHPTSAAVGAGHRPTLPSPSSPGRAPG